MSLGSTGWDIAAKARGIPDPDQLKSNTTLPFRCMGLQQMLLKHRLDFARAMNCSVIISDTDPGNQSQRNLERSGFNLAYVRGIYRRPVTGKPI
jgi:hypothetical protein